MNKKEYYETKLNELLRELKKSPAQIGIFGAGRGGFYILKVLNHFGINAAVFIDNSEDKQGVYQDIPVRKPAEVNPDTFILLGLLNKASSNSVLQSLQTQGFHALYGDIDLFIYAYFFHVNKRSVSIEDYCESLYLFYHSESFVQSPTVSYMITQKCTLRCQDCGAFMLEYKDPKTISAKTVIRDIELFCSSFDIVHHIALQGGEPFTHPALDEILSSVSAIPNLLFVDFVTNGTVVPNDDRLSHISNEGATVLVSDYGDASKQITTLTHKLQSFDIQYDYYKYDSEDAWGSQYPIHKRGREKKVNDALYKSCIKGVYLCMQIMDGEIHRCSFSNNATRLGLIPRFEEGFVSLNQDYDISEKQKEIRALANRDCALEACDFCPVDDRKMVPAGIQVPRNKGEQTK